MYNTSNLPKLPEGPGCLGKEISLKEGMMSVPATTQKKITVDDLRQIGFNERGIKILNILRSVYPFWEYCDTKEWRNLQFLKWRYENTDLREEKPIA